MNGDPGCPPLPPPRRTHMQKHKVHDIVECYDAFAGSGLSGPEGSVCASRYDDAVAPVHTAHPRQIQHSRVRARSLGGLQSCQVPSATSPSGVLSKRGSDRDGPLKLAQDESTNPSSCAATLEGARQPTAATIVPSTASSMVTAPGYPSAASSNPNTRVSSRRVSMEQTAKRSRPATGTPYNAEVTPVIEMERISAFEPEAGTNVSVQPPAPTQGRRKIGDWMIGKTIGEGSSGKVKMAVNSKTGQVCVVKCVRRPRMDEYHTNSGGKVQRPAKGESRSPSQEALEKVHKRELYMIREATLNMLLNHENIVRLFHAELGENHFYCFFEYLEGEDLVDYITRHGKLSEGVSRLIIRQVLSAIEYAHRNYVVHRDIKLENIRFNPSTNVAKVLDFGFATFYSTDRESLLKTNCGSPCYAAPEIYENAAYRGPEIDVWSLGVCLFGMAAGRLPFDAESFHSLAYKIKKGAVVYPQDMSRDLIGRMLTPSIEKRAKLEAVMTHRWVLESYDVPPIDYMECDSIGMHPSISIDFVRRVKCSTIQQAGQLFMEVLDRKTHERAVSRQNSATEGRSSYPRHSVDIADTTIAAATRDTARHEAVHSAVQSPCSRTPAGAPAMLPAVVPTRTAGLWDTLVTKIRNRFRVHPMFRTKDALHEGSGIRSSMLDADSMDQELENMTPHGPATESREQSIRSRPASERHLHEADEDDPSDAKSTEGSANLLKSKFVRFRSVSRSAVQGWFDRAARRLSQKWHETMG
ncbi:kinase-like domain-containing protein, partial [Polychytrium aggregatum]|uniref:kinase-like domain-containing protein n=1 Tax=Polychytrium aggregatum TaxID=110093 RepID=UPI0022FEC5A8